MWVPVQEQKRGTGEVDSNIISVQTLQPVYATMVQRALSQAVNLANRDQRDAAAKKDA